MNPPLLGYELEVKSRLLALKLLVFVGSGLENGGCPCEACGGGSCDLDWRRPCWHAPHALHRHQRARRTIRSASATSRCSIPSTPTSTAIGAASSSPTRCGTA